MNELVLSISPSDQWAIIGRLALAAALGGLIGLEREYRGYAAGVRTMALVCMGSALFSDNTGLFGGDPSRIAAQVVSGIGFLGAGLILREGGSVRGITTAATIWTTAAVGMAVGAQVYVVAVFAALFAIVLLEMRVVTRKIRPAARDHDPEEDAGPDHD